MYLDNLGVDTTQSGFDGLRMPGWGQALTFWEQAYKVNFAFKRLFGVVK